MACLLANARSQGLDGDGARPSRFGFLGPEIFPIDPQIHQLHAADVDGDGLQDLVVANNARSKIALLMNRTGKPAVAPETVARERRELNDLPSDARFRIETVASEKRIASLVVTDLDRDGRPDLAYYGEPKELVAHYNLGEARFGPAKRWPAPDGQLHPNALVAGDANADGRTDLVLIGEHYLYLFQQTAAGGFGEPEKLPVSSPVRSVQLLDVDGDRRDDLLMVNWDSANPFRFRLQRAPGQFGPEAHFAMPPVRSYLADDLDGDHKTEIVSVAHKSGRAQVSGFAREPAEVLWQALKAGQLEVLPLPRTAKNRRGTVWGDLNSDGLAELIVADPESGQLGVCFQEASGELLAPKVFPSLTGVSDMAIGDWDRDGRAELFLLSGEERQVGVTQLDERGRVAFPRALAIDGRPLALGVGALDDTNATVLVLVLDQDGKRTLQTAGPRGTLATQRLADTFKANPASLTIHDVDQDGLQDVVLLVPYEKIKVLRTVSGQAQPFEEIDVAAPGGSAEQPWCSSADIDGDGRRELLLGQKNFVRAVVLRGEGREGEAKRTWTFHVKEQINGAGSNSRVLGAAGLIEGTNNAGALFLLDGERKALTVCRRDASMVWHAERNLELPVSEFTGLDVVALGSRTPNAVAFTGLNMIAWMRLDGQTWRLTERGGYETPIKDGFLLDVVAGDLNHDKRKDLVFLETSKNHLDLVTFEPPHALVPATRWQVFEERTFRNRRADAMEPREALVVDVTGDGKNDLAAIVHDRILVYPQE
jgi:hypothetical protein